jgi:hypothetical protein
LRETNLIRKSDKDKLLIDKSVFQGLAASNNDELINPLLESSESQPKSYIINSDL